jgi:hypothetical protein
MPKLAAVCSHIRSKNAGPFWITIDISFEPEAFEKYAHSEALQAASIASIFQIDAKLVKHFVIDDLKVVKISYPRATVQGGMVERDMHGGQQYVRMLDLEMQDLPKSADESQRSV